MSEVTSEILLVLALIVINGLFAMSEIAIVSARRARLHQLANEGSASAREALNLAEEPNRFLSTVQIGITLVGIFAGAFGGATIAAPVAAFLDQFPLTASYSQVIAFGVVVLTITYLSLVVGELVPKRLGLNNPERIAMRMAKPMRFLSRVAAPAVSFLGFSTELVLRLLRVRPSEEPPVTEEEIEVLIEQGTEVGVFEEAEQDIVSRLFRLSDRRASTLMTPRRKIAWLDLTDPIEESLQQLARAAYSRLVVCENGFDNIKGIVDMRDVLNARLEGRPLDLRAMLREPLFIPESTRALRILEQFKQSGVHMALVIDEYGVVQGLITLNDILEGIVGDLPVADEPVAQQIIQREDGSWLIDGMLPIDEFKDHFDLDELPGEAEGTFQTLGGFILAQLGRLPQPTDGFQWENFCFEVMDMDGNRVDKVLMEQQPRQDGSMAI
jgi:putative hemolysin